MLRRRARLRTRQRVPAQAARHRVNRDDMRDDADRLDILLFAETGGEDATKPSLAEAAGIVSHAMNDLDHDLGQSPAAVVGALDRGGRLRLLAAAARPA